jgi:hypothetical protein
MLPSYGSGSSEGHSNNDVSDFPNAKGATALIVVFKTVVGVVHGAYSCGDQ